MKATGIVRRIDDLGRVVIPKEIRRTMRIREGDPLEIFTGNDQDVIFKKYSPIGELLQVSASYAEVLSRTCGYPVVISDTDLMISAAGIPKKEVLERRVSAALDDLMNKRRVYVWESGQSMLPIDGIDRQARVVSPILVNGDVCGSVILLQKEGEPSGCDKSDVKLVTLAAGFIAKQMEE